MLEAKDAQQRNESEKSAPFESFELKKQVSFEPNQ
jgi:hypothetical protein